MYLDRLRPASFIAPSGDELPFLVDTLTRSGGKKGSTQEILDSDESLSQDQGNKAYTFSVPAYFTGQDYDLDIDAFVKLLEERYTLEKPGVFIHPRWGDIPVFPLGTWEQTEELINGSMVGRLQITFTKVSAQQQPTSDQTTLDDAYANITEMEDESIEIAEGINLDKVSSQTNVIDKIQLAVGIVSNNLKKFVEGVEDLQDEFDSIQKGIDGLVDDIAGNITQTIAAVQRLIRTPGRIVSTSLNKIDGYALMIEELSLSLFDETEVLNVDIKNNSYLMQLITGFAVSAMAEAASFIDFNIRSEATTSINAINNSLDTYNDAFETSRAVGNVSQEYSGDHNFLSLLFDTIARINNILLNNAFDLKAEKVFILKNSSDIITECYKAYGNVQPETIIFFITSNKIVNDEFIELVRGRELTVYV